MYNQGYDTPSYGQNREPAGADVEEDIEDVEDETLEEDTEAEDNVEVDSPKKPKAKKPAVRSGKLTPAERNHRRQLLTSYDFLKSTIDNNEAIKDEFLNIVQAITGPADDIIDTAINLSSLQHRELRSVTKVTDFAIDYVKSRNGDSGMEDMLTLGVTFESFSDEEKESAKAILGYVTNADLSTVKKTAGGLEVLLTLSRADIDTTYSQILDKVRGNSAFIDWK